MKITSLDKIDKTKVTMGGAKDVWKQIPISKNDAHPYIRFGYLPLSKTGTRLIIDTLPNI